MRIYSWGSNFGGQLCAGYRSTAEVLTPLQVRPFPKDFFKTHSLKSIIGGRDQTYFLFENGDVYGCGLNNCGQLGKLPLYVPIPTKLKTLSRFRIIELSARNENAYAITSDGHCIGWGSNSYGQLGYPPFEMVCSSKPKVLCRNALHVSAGGNHVAVITRGTRKLLTCGAHKYGEIGRSFRRNCKPAPVDIPHVAAVACGQSHTIALTRKGELYGWGMNTFGQTGIKPFNYPIIPRPTEIPIEYSIEVRKVKLMCGRNHSVLYANNGQILTWGRNQYGQISTIPHVPEYDWKPAMLRDFCHVESVAVGGNHNIVLHRNKGLHFWGWTEGKCSSKLDHTHKEPYLMKPEIYYPNKSIPDNIFVGAGEKHSVVVLY